MKRHITLISALLLVSLFGSFVQAQTTRVTPCDQTTPNNAICVTGNPVTTDTSGNAITGVTYRVEQRAGSGSYATVATALTTIRHYAQNLTPGTYTFRVFANCSACTAESAASNAASGTATQIPVIPNAPVIIIAATINADGPPTYRIIQSVRLKPNEVVFAAPASMRPLFASR